jgi:hypothetical protein
MALQPFVVPWTLFSYLILYTAGKTPWKRNQPVARPLPAHRTARTQNKYTQTSMPQVGFEPTIPVFERAKTVVNLTISLGIIYYARGRKWNKQNLNFDIFILDNRTNVLHRRLSKCSLQFAVENFGAE